MDGIFGIHEQALLLRSQRSKMIASNIANADTPGYQARDIDFKQVLNQQKTDFQVGLKTTNKDHIKGFIHADFSSEIKYRVPLQPALDGNTVDTQLEKGEYAENTLSFYASLRFLNGRIKGLLNAIKGE